MLDQLYQLTPLLIAVVVASLCFDFVNGWNDSANAIATVVGTRVLSPIRAVLLAAAMNMCGALAGTAVAATIHKGLINTTGGVLDPQTIILIGLAAMCGAMIWAAWMTLLGMPISGSHSLIGGLVGAAVAASGVQVLIGPGIIKVLVALLLSPLIGAVVAFGLILGIYWVVRRWRPRIIRRSFGYLQILSSSVMGFTHGLNDAQKVMGIITMALVAGGVQQADANGQFHPELWVKISCGLVISLGTAIGGWKVIRTLGTNLAELDTVSGCAAETASSMVLFAAAGLGIPVSTTHTITGCIMGVGTRKGIRAVRWSVGQKIILAWIFTLPITAVLAGSIYWILIELGI